MTPASSALNVPAVFTRDSFPSLQTHVKGRSPGGGGRRYPRLLTPTRAASSWGELRSPIGSSSARGAGFLSPTTPDSFDSLPPLLQRREGHGIRYIRVAYNFQL